MAAFSTTTTTSSSILFLFLLFHFSLAKEFLVGGKTDAWKIPPSQSHSLNQWAESSRFQVGDYLVWKYDGEKDSVLQVRQEDYGNCSISNPIKEYNDGITKVKLDHPGAFYFISGAKGHCEKGEKLVVVVLTPRGRNRFSGISPAPSPLFQGPAIAPTSSATPLKTSLVMVLAVFAIWLFSV